MPLPTPQKSPSIISRQYAENPKWPPRFFTKTKGSWHISQIRHLANIIAATLNFVHVEKGMIDGDFWGLVNGHYLDIIKKSLAILLGLGIFLVKWFHYEQQTVRCKHFLDVFICYLFLCKRVCDRSLSERVESAEEYISIHSIPPSPVHTKTTPQFKL